MEVVVLGISDGNDSDDDMDDCYNIKVSLIPMVRRDVGIVVRTCTAWVLSEVLGLVTSPNALGLDFWSCATGKLLVEANNPLHTGSILCCAEALRQISLLRFVVAGSIGSIVSQSIPFNAGVSLQKVTPPISMC